MSALVFYLIGALAGLAAVLLASEAWAAASADVDRMIRRGVEDVDVARWEAEVRDA